ncbi:MAG: hypothetical protein WAN12_03685 [Candidatus Acidiferrum sp.]
MIEGTLEIGRINRQLIAATPEYRILFLPYSGFRNGAQSYKEIVGEGRLSEYLLSLFPRHVPTEWRDGRVRDWLLEVHEKGQLSLPNFQLTEEQCEPFRLAT